MCIHISTRKVPNQKSTNVANKTYMEVEKFATQYNDRRDKIRKGISLRQPDKRNPMSSVLKNTVIFNKHA